MQLSRFRLHSGRYMLHCVCSLCISLWCAVCRGYRQRIMFRTKRDEVMEQERKRKMVEDFAQLVMNEKNSFQPFSQEEPGILYIQLIIHVLSSLYLFVYRW